MKSFTYYLTLAVIRYKGLKNIFSQNPIPYHKLRKDDIHDPKPGRFSPHTFKTFDIMQTKVSEIKPSIPKNYLVIYIHGGAFVYGPVDYHWDAVKKIVSKTSCTLWMLDYPKAPENKIETISENIRKVYMEAVEKYSSENIILIGDSVGGSLILSLVQNFIEEKTEYPANLILISPVMDASFSNPEIDEIERLDPILSKAGALSAKKMCAVNNDLSDQEISPINGSFEDFPRTLLFMAERDITYPDQKRAVLRMKEAGVDLETIVGKDMPHIWPILPLLKEGEMAFNKLIKEINTAVETSISPLPPP